MANEVDPVATGWSRVEEDWDSPEAHRRFLGLCAELDRLADAGTRYRSVRDNDPQRAETAAKQIDSVLAVAMAKLDVTKTVARPRKNRRVLYMAVGVALAMVVYVYMSLGGFR